MVSVTISTGALETGANHVGPEGTDDPNDVGQRDVMTLPFVESFLWGLGETEISHTSESLVDAVVPIGAQQFEGAKDPKLVEQITADLVLSTLTAVQRQLEGGNAVPTRFQR